jgi:hypothetical protein
VGRHAELVVVTRRGGRRIVGGGLGLLRRLDLDPVVDGHPVLGGDDVAAVEQAGLDPVLEQHPVPDPRHARDLQHLAGGAGRHAREVDPSPDLLMAVEVDRGEDGGHGPTVWPDRSPGRQPDPD